MARFHLWELSFNVMTVYSAETNGYKEACELVESFRVAGIESALSMGCVTVYCKPDQVNLAKKICTDSGAIFRSGHIGRTQDILIKSLDGAALLKKAHGDAQAVIKEWEEK